MKIHFWTPRVPSGDHQYEAYHEEPPGLPKVDFQKSRKPPSECAKTIKNVDRVTKYCKRMWVEPNDHQPAYNITIHVGFHFRRLCARA